MESIHCLTMVVMLLAGVGCDDLVTASIHPSSNVTLLPHS